ncbi:MAG: lycopene beta-cyclase CrtY [Rhizobiaceae bacterium]
MNSRKADIIFAGGGLASCLTALRLSEAYPDLSILIVDAADRICGNHTWSFHSTDLTPDEFRFLEPMIAHKWSGQQVIFPGYERVLTTGYNSLTAESVRNEVLKTKVIAVALNSPISEVQETRVKLDSGREFKAPCVIDGRGYRPDDALVLGFQKFIGLELILDKPHGETVPTIMDSSVEQFDGYRFVYTLPFDAKTVLVEDTRYSDSDKFDEKTIIANIRDHVQSKGWTIKKVLRQENGVLPITLGHDFSKFWNNIGLRSAPIGLRAGLFHPTTGYSLPHAVRLATGIAEIPGPHNTKDVRKLVEKYAYEQYRKQSYYRFLNRMLFKAAVPGDRWKVLARFYKLPQGLIERFYAGRLTIADRARILIGKPPVPVSAAMKCISEKSVYNQSEVVQ